MVDVNNDYATFQNSGGEVALVTMGNVDQTAAFRHRFALPFICFADPGQRGHQAFEVPIGRLGQFAGPAVWIPGLKSLLHKGAGKPIGDVRRMPAAFVIDTSGTIRYVHYAANAAQYPSHQEIITILKDLGMSPTP